MLYAVGALVGLIFGSTVAFLKDRLLWGRYLERATTDEGTGGILVRSAISFGINVAALTVVFLLRNHVPFSWVACIVATAFALTGLNTSFAARKKQTENHD